MNKKLAKLKLSASLVQSRLVFVMFAVCTSLSLNYSQEDEKLKSSERKIKYILPVNLDSITVIKGALAYKKCSLFDYMEKMGVNVNEGETYTLNKNDQSIVIFASNENAKMLMFLLLRLMERTNSNFSIEELIQVYSFQKRIEDGKVLDLLKPVR